VAYQDRWVRGAVVAGGDRSCEDRYALIAKVVRAYKRQITVLDLGANLGYFGCRLADELGAVSVMVDSRTDLAHAVAENALPTTIVLQRKLSVHDLAQLAACEHFDVVLALNILHHFREWPTALQHVLRLGTDIIIETPARDDRSACRFDACVPLIDAIRAESPILIGTSPSHVTAGVDRPLYWLTREKTALARGYLDGDRVGAPPVRPHQIVSGAYTKRIQFADGEGRNWVPGINLWTWRRLGGVRPSLPEVLAGVIEAAPGHGDLRPWNFVLSGDRVVAIDADHRSKRGGEDHLRETLAAIENPDLLMR
jgi:hypothetical protein